MDADKIEKLIGSLDAEGVALADLWEELRSVLQEAYAAIGGSQRDDWPKGEGEVRVVIPWGKNQDGSLGQPGEPSVSVVGDLDADLVAGLVDEAFSGANEAEKSRGTFVVPTEPPGEWIVGYPCPSCGRIVARVFFEKKPAESYGNSLEERPPESLFCKSCRAAGEAR